MNLLPIYLYYGVVSDKEFLVKKVGIKIAI